MDGAQTTETVAVNHRPVTIRGQVDRPDPFASVSAVLRRLLALGVAAHQEQATTAAPMSSPAPEPEAVAGTVPSRACGHFKPRPGNALWCFNCGERHANHS
jgi:hypothetical protein